jgi:hypothetical protein
MKEFVPLAVSFHLLKQDLLRGVDWATARMNYLFLQKR